MEWWIVLVLPDCCDEVEPEGKAQSIRLIHVSIPSMFLRFG